MELFSGINENIIVFDNSWLKPPQIDGTSDFSIAVLFRAGFVWYFGQYCYSQREWHRLPSCTLCENIKEDSVDAWMFSPPSFPKI